MCVFVRIAVACMLLTGACQNGFSQEPVAAAGETVARKEMAANNKSRQPIVIVHGAWGGRHHWKETATELAKHWRGPIYRAALTGQGERSHLASPTVNLQTHIGDVKNLIEFEDLQNVILIGHSYGGIVISGVADQMPDRLSQLLYLDASLLDSGENFFSHDADQEKALTKRAQEAGEGWAIPVDWPNPMRDVPHPLATMTDKLMLKNDARNKIPAEYWAFTDGGPLEKDSRYFYYSRAKKRGYTVKDFKWGHNPHRQSPQEVAGALLKAVATTNTPKTDKQPDAGN